MSRDEIKVIPLGGVCEIGKNMMLYEYDEKILIVDCGVMFPDEELPGVDIIIPDFTYLRDNRERIAGLVLTHGHEDHVGAMAYFLREFPEVPVYGAPLTLGIMSGRLREHPIDPKSLNTNKVHPGDTINVGPFTVEFIRVGHSIPDACGLAITTDLGTIIQSGDFKFDQTPIDKKPPQFARFAQYGEAGVMALLSDTTNAGRPGLTGSESSVRPGLERIFADAPGRIFVATFASNVHRVQQVLDIAALYERRVACTGRSMLTITSIATELGYLHPPQPIIDIEEIDNYADDEICVLMTGSQGEPLAALSKVARHQNRFVELREKDTVILSSTPIPGNEGAIFKIINALCLNGAHVFRAPNHPVHVSGHGNQEDLKLMLNLTRPKFAVPYHGEARHALAYADICEQVGYRREDIPFLQVGDVLSVSPNRCEIVGSVAAGSVLVDGLTVGDVGTAVLRDRRHLADDGVVVATVIMDKQTGAILSGPDLTQRGFLHQPNSEEFMQSATKRVRERLEQLHHVPMGDEQGIARAVRETLADFIGSSMRRRPMILPVILEV
ncbi:MAG: ribonuclease J [Abitibacteriaceae bacterium]|nr:ribonuclease J [Abditibacteriaceae bacterium]